MKKIILFTLMLSFNFSCYNHPSTDSNPVEAIESSTYDKEQLVEYLLNDQTFVDFFILPDLEEKTQAVSYRTKIEEQQRYFSNDYFKKYDKTTLAEAIGIATTKISREID